MKLCLTPSASREVVGLCLTPCAFTTLAIIATSTHSIVATLLAIAIVALSPESDIDPAEAP